MMYISKYVAAALGCAFMLASCEKTTTTPAMPDEESVIEGEEFPTEDTDISTYKGRTLVAGAGQSECSSALAKRLVNTGYTLEDELDLIVLGESFAYDDVSNTAVYARCIEMFDEGHAIALVRPTCKELETFRIALCNAYDMYVAIQAELCGSDAVAPASVKDVMARFSIPEDGEESDVPYEIVAICNSGFFYQYGFDDPSVDSEETVEMEVTPYVAGAAANNFVEWVGSRQTIADQTRDMGPAIVRSAVESDGLESIYESITSVYYLPAVVHRIPYAAYMYLVYKTGIPNAYDDDMKYDWIPDMTRVTVRAWGCHSYSLNEDYYLVKQEITLYNGRLLPSPVTSGNQWHYDQQSQCFYTRYFDNLEATLSMSDQEYKGATIVSSLPEAENSATEYSMSVAKTSGYSVGFSAGVNGSFSEGLGGNLGLGLNLSESTTITNSTARTVKDIDMVKNSPDEYTSTWTYTGAKGYAEEDKNGKLYHTEGSLQRSDCTLEQSVIFKISTRSSVRVFSKVRAFFSTLLYFVNGGSQWLCTVGKSYDEHRIELWKPARNLRHWTMNVSSYGNFTTVEEKKAFLDYLSTNCSAFWQPYLEVGETDREDNVMLGSWRRFNAYMESHKEYFRAFGCSGHFEFVCRNLDEENVEWTCQMDL